MLAHIDEKPTKLIGAIVGFLVLDGNFIIYSDT